MDYLHCFFTKKSIDSYLLGGIMKSQPVETDIQSEITNYFTILYVKVFEKSHEVFVRNFKG